MFFVEGSQPPFLSRMVRAIFSETGDLGLVARALPILKVEYEFWTTGDFAVFLFKISSTVNLKRLQR